MITNPNATLDLTGLLTNSGNKSSFDLNSLFGDLSATKTTQQPSLETTSAGGQKTTTGTTSESPAGDLEKTSVSPSNFADDDGPGSTAVRRLAGYTSTKGLEIAYDRYFEALQRPNQGQLDAAFASFVSEFIEMFRIPAAYSWIRNQIITNKKLTQETRENLLDRATLLKTVAEGAAPQEKGAHFESPQKLFSGNDALQSIGLLFPVIAAPKHRIAVQNHLKFLYVNSGLRYSVKKLMNDNGTSRVPFTEYWLKNDRLKIGTRILPQYGTRLEVVRQSVVLARLIRNSTYSGEIERDLAFLFWQGSQGQVLDAKVKSLKLHGVDTFAEFRALMRSEAASQADKRRWFNKLFNLTGGTSKWVGEVAARQLVNKVATQPVGGRKREGALPQQTKAMLALIVSRATIDTMINTLNLLTTYRNIPSILNTMVTQFNMPARLGQPGPRIQYALALILLGLNVATGLMDQFEKPGSEKGESEQVAQQRRTMGFALFASSLLQIAKITAYHYYEPRLRRAVAEFVYLSSETRQLRGGAAERSIATLIGRVRAASALGLVSTERERQIIRSFNRFAEDPIMRGVQNGLSIGGMFADAAAAASRWHGAAIDASRKGKAFKVFSGHGIGVFAIMSAFNFYAGKFITERARNVVSAFAVAFSWMGTAFTFLGAYARK